MSVRAAHLLIKHTGSRNPVSRRTNETITLSPEDAMKELQEYEGTLDNIFSQTIRASVKKVREKR